MPRGIKNDDSGSLNIKKGGSGSLVINRPFRNNPSGSQQDDVNDPLVSYVLSVTTERLDNFEKDLEKKIEKISKDKLNSIETKVKELNQKTEKSIEDLSNKETKLIETLGIFFALFAFITIDVQIFSRVTDLFSASIFSFLLFALLAMIILLFDLLLMKRYKLIWYYIAAVIGLLLLCLICMSKLQSIKLNDSNYRGDESLKEDNLHDENYEAIKKIIQETLITLTPIPLN